MAVSDVSIVLAEEYLLVRDGLAAICASRPRNRIVAQVGDGASALKAILSQRPDVAILDLNLPVLYSLEVVRRIRENGSPTRAIILSNRSDRKTILEALRSGACAFVLRSGPAEHLLDAIEQVAAGEVYVSPQVQIDKVFQSDRRECSGDPIARLSAREYQVFSLLVDGIRAKEIAARLELSPKTVDTYRASLMRKLDIHDVAGLVKFALQKKLISM
ncbi:MAG: response regulator transcription factor [Bryobacteraceae bacterium]|jgi:Response regulator containing a CheY-like receiver domain and an HTH DNA-binding domain|nr:response regulator transcription factor [Bryobacteraceae bacterium]